MSQPGATSMLLEVFNTAARVDAERDAARCCASSAFAAAIAAGRPYPDFDALDTAIDAGFAELSWADITEALRDHSRIGEPTQAGWSRAEQAGAAEAAPAVAAELAAANRAYEERFGHVFLVCATGLSAEDMLARLWERMAHDPAAERAVVADELRKITRLRMRKLLGG